MTTLRLGISPCPNDVFLFAGILLGTVDTAGHAFAVDYQDIENLNERAQAGDLDVAKISYANYIRCRQHYDLLDCGGALGRGCGPLLLCHGGAFDPDGEVLVPGEYTTANFLLDYYLGGRPVRKTFLAFDALYRRLLAVPGAQGVVIHEKRFTYERDGLTLVQDLGSHWEDRTGYPIPLGAIGLRREVGVPVTVMERILRDSLAWAESHRPTALALCKEHAQDLDEDVIQAHIALYVNDFSRDLGDEGRAAVAFFLEQQAALRGRSS